MKTIKAIPVILILFLSMPVFSSEGSTLFSLGNRFYQEKKYEKAVEAYEKILDKGVVNSDVYYNLGCCYFRMKKPAQSRLYFETALKLNPGDTNILKNLSILKATLKDTIETHEDGFILKTYRSFLHMFSINTISVILLLTLTSLFLAAGLIISGRIEMKPLLYWLGISILLFGLTLSLFVSRHKIINQNDAVVMRQEISVYSEPSSGSSLLFKIHAGTKVLIENKQQGFYHISLPNGMNGWTDKEYLQKIEIPES